MQEERKTPIPNPFRSTSLFYLDLPPRTYTARISARAIQRARGPVRGALLSDIFSQASNDPGAVRFGNYTNKSSG